MDAKRNKIKTIKLGRYSDLTLGKAIIFMQFLGPNKTFILHSMKSIDFVKALVMINNQDACVKIDGIE